MKGTKEIGGFSKTFLGNLPSAMAAGDSYPETLLLREYGSAFVARGGAVPPDRVVFADAEEVERFQSTLDLGRETIGGVRIELQAAAMDGLRKAIAEAKSRNFTITPRGQDSARRSYEETIDLWASRVEPALEHWVANGRMTRDQAENLRSLSPFEQVPEVLKLEQQGIWFAKDLSKSVIYSVAPPGTSQHLSMLAFDVKEHGDLKVRDILAKNGWYQTVISDLPHFTYLGATDSELPKLGLRKASYNGRTFWIPE